MKLLFGKGGERPLSRVQYAENLENHFLGLITFTPETADILLSKHGGLEEESFGWWTRNAGQDVLVPFAVSDTMGYNVVTG